MLCIRRSDVTPCAEKTKHDTRNSQYLDVFGAIPQRRYRPPVIISQKSSADRLAIFERITVCFELLPLWMCGE
jgi:hypothetical protein